jgi:hypothetical protein
LIVDVGGLDTDHEFVCVLFGHATDSLYR